MRRWTAAFTALLFVALSAQAALAAAPNVRLAAAHSGNNVKLTVVGGSPRTGAYRTELVRGDTGRGVRVELTISDIIWTGQVQTISVARGVTRVTSTQSLTGFIGNETAIFNFRDARSGISFNTGSITAPANGNRTMIVTFVAPRGVHLNARGAVRIASEAFMFGPWITTSAARFWVAPRPWDRSRSR